MSIPPLRKQQAITRNMPSQTAHAHSNQHHLHLPSPHNPPLSRISLNQPTLAQPHPQPQPKQKPGVHSTSTSPVTSGSPPILSTPRINGSHTASVFKETILHIISTNAMHLVFDSVFHSIAPAFSPLFPLTSMYILRPPEETNKRHCIMLRACRLGAEMPNSDRAMF
ncbi:hypothetical protein M440DRAFT_1138430 [Trichoderma longibrachiatum ATCC 18648]|uniref:Uncharacterized protein n=1 Tax=Trichoderma longibrachiatum ATCC 18648 TaxID=983965 RepID=A0A2T4BRH7_TRILO|nr:hypothetical protein M440DRAFT_1138430 [Trichoderma longibrachiatum ATCC 18648]